VSISFERLDIITVDYVLGYQRSCQIFTGRYLVLEGLEYYLELKVKY